MIGKSRPRIEKNGHSQNGDMKRISNLDGGRGESMLPGRWRDGGRDRDRERERESPHLVDWWPVIQRMSNNRWKVASCSKKPQRSSWSSSISHGWRHRNTDASSGGNRYTFLDSRPLSTWRKSSTSSHTQTGFVFLFCYYWPARNGDVIDSTAQLPDIFHIRHSFRPIFLGFCQRRRSYSATHISETQNHWFILFPLVSHFYLITIDCFFFDPFLPTRTSH